jgi:hypothetical protein
MRAAWKNIGRKKLQTLYPKKEILSIIECFAELLLQTHDPLQAARGE